ncbi:unnamed protein product [Schistosoma turkestanicum]|nr:unnamed protein product [Schistosoma turkestanicum]
MIFQVNKCQFRQEIPKRTMNTLFSSLFVAVVVFVCFDVASGVPEPRDIGDESSKERVVLDKKPATLISISVNQTPTQKPKKVEMHDEKRHKRSSSSTLIIGCPIVFTIAPFVISKFLL